MQSGVALLDGRADQPWVIDLSAVDYIGSATIGLIINIRQRIKSAGGRLVLCGLSARIMDIFHTSSMERLFTIARSRNDAVKVLAK